MEIKLRWILFSGLICLLFFVGATPPKPKAVGIRKVVIDAGHGGHDPGTMGKHTKEKDVALAVALRLGKYIQENFPEVEVVFTRKTDVFVELYRRAQMANESKADLFISIHCNGTKSPQAKGTETWVMGLHKSKENLEVAKTENATILMEDNLAKYDGFDPNSPEANIIFSLYQNVYLDKSLDIASKVQKYFRVRMNSNDRGVKQAGFWVLYKTTMPGILIETGFLSNPDDEQLLSSEQGQDQIASSIFHAFREYKEEVEGLAFTGTRTPKEPITPAKEPDSKQISQKNPEPEIVEHKTPPAKSPENPKTLDKSGDEGKQTEKHLYSGKSLNTNDENKPVVNGSYVYKVQIASSDKVLKEGNPIFKGVRGVSSYKHKGMIKYVVGEAASLKEALEIQKKMAGKGFKDAFVVVFQDGERVPEDVAKKLIPKM